MALHSLNLNLLPVLRELLHRRSITDAGMVLGRSPSAISQGLAQLRSIFDDPLLVRAGGAMVLTPRAEQLIGPVEEACAQMERVMRIDSFDPAQSDRQFVIAATDFDAFAYGPTLVRAIGPLAPHVQIRFIDVGRDLHDQIVSRDIDFALLPDFLLIDLASDRMRCQPVGSSATVAIMRHDHALAASPNIDRAALDEWGHVAFLPSWEVVGRRTALVANRQPLHAVTIVPHMAMLPHYVSGTDHLALAPDVIARRLGPGLGLVHRPLAFDEPLVRSVLAWGPHQQADPAHRWLRERAIPALQFTSAMKQS